MPKRMVSPKISEISGVDHPAHLTEGWLLMKDASPETAEILRNAELIAKGIDPNSIKGKHQMPDLELTDEEREALPENVQKYVEGLEAVAKAATETEDEPTDEEVAYTKAIESLPEPVRKRLAEQQKALAENQRIAKELYDEREDARFESMTKSLDSVPKVDTEFAKSLRAVASADPVAFEKVYEVLKAANGAIAESALYKEIGAAGNASPDSGQGAIEAFAKSLRDADPDLSVPESIALAAEQKPELYTQHRAEYTAQQRGLI